MPPDAAPLLLPVPRRCERLPGVCVVPDPLTVAGDPGPVQDALHRPLTTGVDGFLRLAVAPGPGEGYHLAVLPDHIDIRADGRPGLRHALATLDQLLVQYGGTLPCLRIDDAPAFAIRGVMLDISRDRVPTMASLEALITTLAGFKINHLQLYMEHTFAYAGHDEVWRHASPLTEDEVQRLDALCQRHGIALVANQNCLGHLERWFRHPRYTPLAEIPPGQSWDFGGIATKTGPFSLCPGDPRSLALIEDLLGQLLPNFHSPQVNIGCDEAFDIGQGRSADEVAKRGRASVYLEMVSRICAVAQRHGKQPLFWADIALEHPEALAALPADLIGLAWGYEPDAPFARWVGQLRAAGRSAWVCPGTSCWRSITGRTTERRANLLAAARDGQAAGAEGYLTTIWGDLGHRQQWPVTLAALAEGCHRAWSGTAVYDPRAASLHAFGDPSLTVATWLDALGDVDLDLRQSGPIPLRNATALFTDLGKGLDESWIGESGDWRHIINRIQALLMPACLGFMPHVDRLIGEELMLSANEAYLAAARAGWRRAMHRDPAFAVRLRQRQDAIVHRYRQTWLARCRPGGLEDSIARYSAIELP